MKPLWVAACAVLALLCLAEPATAAPRLDPQEHVVRVETPAPGHTSEWTMRVRADSTGLARPSITLREASGDALEGPHPLELEVVAPGRHNSERERTVLAHGTADDLLDRLVPLDQPEAATAVEAGWITVQGRATLPSGAGNEYGGTGATLRFTFSGELDRNLAMTGQASMTVWVIIAAAVGIGLGTLLGRRRSARETERNFA